MAGTISSFIDNKDSVFCIITAELIHALLNFLTQHCKPKQPRHPPACVAVDEVPAGGSIGTRLRGALVDVDITHLARKSLATLTAKAVDTIHTGRVVHAGS